MTIHRSMILSALALVLSGSAGARADSAPVVVTNDATAPVPVTVSNQEAIPVSGNVDAMQTADTTRFIVGSGPYAKCVPVSDGSGQGLSHSFLAEVTLPTAPVGQRIIVDEVSLTLEDYFVTEGAATRLRIYTDKSNFITLAVPLQDAEGNYDTGITGNGKPVSSRLRKAHLNTTFPVEAAGSIAMSIRYARPTQTLAYDPLCDFTVVGHFATAPPSRGR
jgi:hypothetical protein